MLTLRSCVVDLDAHEVHREGERAALTNAEVAMLRLLVAAEGRPVPREAILTGALGFAPGVQSRAADHAVTRLRKKLEADPSAPDHLLSVYGVGYRWVSGAANPGLVGRTEELAALTASERRCVVLVGPGGMGKTRLAQAHVRGRAHTWVSLQACVDVDEALARVRVELGLGPTADIGDALVTRGKAQLVLDELEHLPAVEPHVARWLETASDLRVLLTSRRLPQLDAQVIRPRPLDPAHTAALVQQRTGADAPPDLSPALLDLLGGLPLAIELVAARARVLAWHELAERSDRLDVLGDGVRTMRAALDGTWELLDPAGRRAWCALGVFRGGFDAAAWEAVWNQPDALDRLQQLVDWCLVRRDTSSHRFEVPATVRLFAAEQLAGTPDGAALRQRHAAWYGRLGAALEDQVRRAGDPGWLRTEQPNLRAAFDSGQADHRVTRALDTALNLYGPPGLRVTLLERAAARPLSPDDAADLRWRRADALMRVGRPGDALATLGPEDDHPRCTYIRGSVHLAMGELDAAEVTLRAAEALLTDDPARAAIARFNRSHVLALRGQLDEASDLARRALAQVDAAGATAVRGGILSGLAAYALEAGALDEAEVLLRRAQASEGRVHRLHQLRLEYAAAHVCLARGELGRALDAFEGTRGRALQAGIVSVADDCDEGVAAVRCAQGAWADALALLDRVQVAHRRRGRHDREAGLVLRAGLVEAMLGGDGRPRIIEVVGPTPTGEEARGVLASLHRHHGDGAAAEALGTLTDPWTENALSSGRAAPGSLLRLARRLAR